MMDQRTRLEGSGQAWSVFFGVAAIVIGALVLVSRILAAFESDPAPLNASALVVPAPTPATFGARGLDKPLELPDKDVYNPASALAAAGGGEASPLSTDPASMAGQPATPACPTIDCPESSAGQTRAEPEAVAPADEPGGPSVAAPPPEPVPPAAPAIPPPPRVSASSFAILERSCLPTGQAGGGLVYGVNENARVPPASLAKIVTAMVVAERANLNTMVDIKDVSAKNLIRTTDSSVMGVEPGMRFSVRDLLYGLMLPSGNDAALVLARQVAGSVPGFVGLMNDKAAALGMANTHFTNPHGLDDPGLYSTARDMAVAGRMLLENPLLMRITFSAQYETPGEVRILMKNGNSLLQKYPGTFGVKIGYTTNAKQTIVAAANRGGRELIVSVMGSEDRYRDSIALFDWAFANTPKACG